MHSPDLAPPEHHAVTVYTIAPNHLRDGTWADRRDELAEKLLIEAERIVPGLRARSQVQVTLTPEDFRARTRQEHHSFGGVAPVMGKEAPPHHTPVEGLWFIGSQSASGAGVAPVIAGTRKVVVQQVLNRG
jgi:phytoene dehydrogenase-like protein